MIQIKYIGVNQPKEIIEVIDKQAKSLVDSGRYEYVKRISSRSNKINKPIAEVKPIRDSLNK